jgi:hypothetical protein
MVTVAIQQPTYLPWLGYFEQIARSDVFVFLNCVQFERHSWQNRNRLRTVAGQPYFLTVPIERAPLETLIRDVSILRRNQTWVRKHLLSMQASLRHAPYYEKIRPIVERWIVHDVSLLADMNIALITDFVRLLGLKTKLVLASDLGVTGSKTDLVIDICRALNADHYYSAAGSAEYLDTARFAEHGMTVAFQDWAHPQYHQVGAGFVSHLSIVDALMNVGADETRRMLGID